LLSKEHLRTGCDLTFTLLVFEDSADVAHSDHVQLMADITMEALHNPHTPRPKDEWIGGEVTRQFWELAIKTASPGSQKRFIEAIDTYAQSVVQEAKDRSQRHIRTVDEYMEVRRDTIGLKPSFAILEAGLNLPDEVVRHPVIQRLLILAAEMVLLDNDMISYNIEQARGDNHNIVAIIMHHNKTDIQGAMDWVHRYHKEVQAEFMDIYENKIPKFGEPVDTELAQYVDGVGNLVRAHFEWSYGCERYHGKKGEEIQNTRWVTLLPKTVQ